MARKLTPLTPSDARALLASLPDPGPDAPCLCGCGSPAPREFQPGHDARLKGQLARLIASPSVPRALRAQAVDRMLQRGWARFIRPNSADDLGTLPTQDPTDRRRRVDVCHIDAMVEHILDKADVSHSHPECPHIEGSWSRHRLDATPTGWLCSGCIEVATPAERVSRQSLIAWVLQDPTDSANADHASLLEWYGRCEVRSAEAARCRSLAILALSLDPHCYDAVIASLTPQAVAA